MIPPQTPYDVFIYSRALTLYSTRTEAFTQEDRATGSMLAVIAAHLISAALAQEQIVQLRQGLESNREIGRACGIIMARGNLTPDQAIDLLRQSSQRSNRKLRDIATDIVDTVKRPRFDAAPV